MRLYVRSAMKCKSSNTVLETFNTFFQAWMAMCNAVGTVNPVLAPTSGASAAFRAAWPNVGTFGSAANDVPGIQIWKPGFSTLQAYVPVRVDVTLGMNGRIINGGRTIDTARQFNEAVYSGSSNTPLPGLLIGSFTTPEANLDTNAQLTSQASQNVRTQRLIQSEVVSANYPVAFKWMTSDLTDLGVLTALSVWSRVNTIIQTDSDFKPGYDLALGNVPNFYNGAVVGDMTWAMTICMSFDVSDSLFAVNPTKDTDLYCLLPATFVDNAISIAYSLGFSTQPYGQEMHQNNGNRQRSIPLGSLLTTASKTVSVVDNGTLETRTAVDAGNLTSYNINQQIDVSTISLNPDFLLP